MIPEWNKPPQLISVQALRDFIASFGPDVAVLVTWTHEGGYQLLTVGATREYADGAVRLRERIERALDLERLGPGEDLRAEHPDPRPWTNEEKLALDDVLRTLEGILPRVPVEGLLQALYRRAQHQDETDPR